MEFAQHLLIYIVKFSANLVNFIFDVISSSSSQQNLIMCLMLYNGEKYPGDKNNRGGSTNQIISID